jgi:glycogen debranching enzyme
MDAKVDGWVVTPRRGKAVEINALWYNALKLMEQWATEQGDTASAEYGRLAGRVFRSFNERFWYEDGGHLFDVIDGEDPASGSQDRRWNDAKCRPNQIFAVALPHPVLDRSRWAAVVETVRDRLLTPVGLRSLAPGDPDYKTRYFGDLPARDAAYHQGTVWAWLAGPFVDAWLRVHPEDAAGAWRAVHGFAGHLDRACVGSISEVFDADSPYTARGCIAQAWSVAEVLRVLVKLEQGAPAAPRLAHASTGRPAGEPVSLRAPSSS